MSLWILSWRFPNEQSYTELYIYLYDIYIYCIYFWGEVHPPKLWGKRENVFHSNRIETINILGRLGDPEPRNFFIVCIVNHQRCRGTKPSLLVTMHVYVVFLEVRSPICSFSFSFCPTLELILKFLCIYTKCVYPNPSDLSRDFSWSLTNVLTLMGLFIGGISHRNWLVSRLFLPIDMRDNLMNWQLCEPIKITVIRSVMIHQVPVTSHKFQPHPNPILWPLKVPRHVPPHVSNKLWPSLKENCRKLWNCIGFWIKGLIPQDSTWFIYQRKLGSNLSSYG